MTLLQNLWPRSVRLNISVIFAALALVACGTPQPAQVAASAQAMPKVDTPEFDTPEFDTPDFDTPDFDTPDFDTPKFVTHEFDTPEKVVAPDPSAEIYPEPNLTTGLNRQLLITLLGEPGFMRRDGPAEIWQYKTLACTLDVFLYKDAVGPTYRVTYFETRGAARTTTDCVVSVVRTTHDRPAS